MRHYCCYFDHRYAPRALAMIRSLRQFEPDAPIWVLCLNEVCHGVMTAVAEPGVHLISMPEFEAGDAALGAARHNRSLIEYYFTCTPSLIRFVLQRCAALDSVTYVDGDLYFFSNPVCLHDELGDQSVSLIPHRFPEGQRQREVYGLYNVGWLTFRNDPAGLAVVNWWRDRCNEWCYDRLDGERFADQKYLDRVPGMFPGVRVLENPGANVAPWNLGRYHLRRAGTQIQVSDGAPLVFFHFHGIKPATSWCYILGLRQYGAELDHVTRCDLYRPYLTLVGDIERFLRTRVGTALSSGSAALLQRDGQHNASRNWRDVLRPLVRSIRATLRRDALVVIAGRVI